MESSKRGDVQKEREAVAAVVQAETRAAEVEGGSGGEGGGGVKRTVREQGKEERKGRPTNAERLVRDRAQSYGSILDYISVKRKRREISPESEEQKAKSKRSVLEGARRIDLEREVCSVEVEREVCSVEVEREVCSVEVEREVEDTNAEKMGEQWESKSEKEIMLELLKRFNEEKDNTKREMEKMKEELLKEINYMRKEDRRYREETKRRLDKLEERIENSERATNKEEVKNRLEILEARSRGGISKARTDQSEAEKEIQEIRKIMERKEREERKLNVIIKGLETSSQGKNLESEIEKFLRDNIETNVEVETARAINGGRMIQVKFRKWEDRNKIMHNKKKLGDKKIYIDNDRTKKEREVQKNIVAHAKE
ncbi:trichohyalin-like [Monomorium pharaonis]|uniref:trichohyalin-like n=1 Tax=Monomorium pharaonis TaxID=307658 RepID=UPI0017472CA5|nr:trichohyalin-like [Monomorium pharaonis]